LALHPVVWFWIKIVSQNEEVQELSDLIIVRQTLKAPGVE